MSSFDPPRSSTDGARVRGGAAEGPCVPRRDGAVTRRCLAGTLISGAAVAASPRVAVAGDEGKGGEAKASGFVSVADHGARGDGRNDDTPAFLAAIARAEAASPKRAVYVPSGAKYRLTRTLDINQSTLWSD